MSAYHGKKGNAVFSSALVNLQSWALNAIGEPGPTTSMGDGFAQALPGLVDFNATASGKVQIALDTVALVGTGSDLELVMEDGVAAITGAAILTSLTETVTFDAPGTIDYTFEGNDAEGLSFSGAGTAAAGAATALHGKQCNAAHGGDLTNVRGWSYTLTAGTVDTTAAHATQAGRTRVAGFITGTATVTVLADSADAAAPEVVVSDASGVPTAIATLTLSRSATVGDGVISGSAVVTNTAYGTDTEGVAIITYSFQFTDTIEFATT